MGAVLVLALTMLVPLFWMISTSLMSEQEALSYPSPLLPEHPQWQNYREAVTLLPFLRFLLNSVIMTSAVVVLQLTVCSTAAYAFARLRFPGRNKLFLAYLATLMVPPVVIIIPQFLLMVDLKWKGTYLALIAPYASSVWGIFLLRQFFQTLPRELEDAARIDGAGELTIFFRIVLPLSKPALATLAVFAATSTWQAFLWPLIVTDTMEMRPLSVGIALFASLHERHPQYQMAAAVLAILPMLVVFLWAQRYFIRGIALTGLKG
jgi:multiple sugar transport system permease protein